MGLGLRRHEYGRLGLILIFTHTHTHTQTLIFLMGGQKSADISADIQTIDRAQCTGQE